MKPLRTWALIADGAHARMIENSGPLHGEDGHDPVVHGWNDVTIDKEPSSNANPTPTSEDHNASTTIRPERSSTTSFAHQLAVILDHQLALKAYYRLIIAAPPAMLGELRSAISAPVRASLVGEFHHDLTKIANSEIADHLKLHRPG